MVRAAALILALLIGSPAFAADQFDLSCISNKQKKGRPPIVLKIDLANREWCIDKCEIVSRIKEVTSSMIVLSESYENGIEAGQRVDRLTGAYYFYENKLADPLFGYWKSEGACTAGPFTGFAKGKF